MKLQLVVFQLVCLTLAWARTAVEDDLEEAPVQPFKPVKPNPLKSSKSIPVPTKTTQAPPQSQKPPQQEPEYADEGEQKDYEDDAPSSAATSTTEPSKKIGNGVVRPFRSNQDLLATLKRRRQEKAAAGPLAFEKPSTTPAPSGPPTPGPRAKAKAARNNYNGNNYNARSRAQSPEESDQTGSESEKTTVNRRFSGARGRSSFSSTTQTYEEVPEEAPAPPPSRNRNFGRSRRV